MLLRRKKKEKNQTQKEGALLKFIERNKEMNSLRFNFNPIKQYKITNPRARMGVRNWWVLQENEMNTILENEENEIYDNLFL